MTCLQFNLIKLYNYEYEKVLSLALLMLCGTASAQVDNAQSASGTSAQDTTNVTKMDKISQRNPVGNSTQPQDKAYIKNEDKSKKKTKSKTPAANGKTGTDKNNPDPIAPAK